MSQEFWEFIESESPSLDEVFPKDYEDIPDPKERLEEAMKTIEKTRYHVWFHFKIGSLTEQQLKLTEQQVEEFYKLVRKNPGSDSYDCLVEDGTHEALLTPRDNTFRYTQQLHLEVERMLGYGSVEVGCIVEKVQSTFRFDSPIEQKFWEAWLDTEHCDYFELTPQYPIGRYRVDFANALTKTAIELDGHATHSSPDAIAYDRQRQRYIESQGWRVIRFGGKEVYANANACAKETGEILKRRPYVK